jgi:hypothetical protein
LGCPFWLSAVAEREEIRRCFYSLSAAAGGGKLLSRFSPAEPIAILSLHNHPKCGLILLTKGTFDVINLLMNATAFEQEMGSFFRGYSSGERELLEANTLYRNGRNDCNVEEAQRIANEILEGNMPSTQSARLFRKLRAS